MKHGGGRAAKSMVGGCGTQTRAAGGAGRQTIARCEKQHAGSTGGGLEMLPRYICGKGLQGVCRTEDRHVGHLLLGLQAELLQPGCVVTEVPHDVLIRIAATAESICGVVRHLHSEGNKLGLSLAL